MTAAYDIIIGLEVHVQLLTRTKLFCRCSTQFGAPPNTQTCPVCAGLPGALPVMNGKAYQLALRTALALNCEIPRLTKWDRKNYFYPDLPKGYQISQYDLPMSKDGWLEISDFVKQTFPPKRIGMVRAHLEEDAGKSMHEEGGGDAAGAAAALERPSERDAEARGAVSSGLPMSKSPSTRIDLNRAGTPLLEIVTRPDLRSPLEAKTFLTELKLLLSYLGVSDCNMQEGSLRVDANVNLHIHAPGGKVATPIVEVKNMNSFRAVERALAYEAERQLALWAETGQQLGQVPKQTRGWDDAAGVTRPQRSKEEEHDYRYFPDPDLVPVVVTDDEVEAVRAELGELPAALRQRLADDYGISPYDADVLVNQGRPLVDYFIALAERIRDGKLASNWVQQDVMRTLGERRIGIEALNLPVERLADLLARVQRGELITARAREVLAQMLETGQPADAVIRSLGIEQVGEEDLVALCRELLAENPQIVEQVKQGKTKAAASLVGQAKKRNPNANPGRVQQICLELIEKM